MLYQPYWPELRPRLGTLDDASQETLYVAVIASTAMLISSQNLSIAAFPLGIVVGEVHQLALEIAGPGMFPLKSLTYSIKHIEQSVLTRKHAAILFLHSLASSQPSQPSHPAFLPSLDVPPSRQSSSHAPRTPIEVPNGTATGKGKGKSRAQILSEYRVKMGKSYSEFEFWPD